MATVVFLFKKGDASLPENLRPISLLPVGYKVVASMIRKRLQHGGAEQRMRPTQFGFRPGRSEIDAITIPPHFRCCGMLAGTWVGGCLS